MTGKVDAAMRRKDFDGGEVTPARYCRLRDVAYELEAANVGLADEAARIRTVLGELVAAGDALEHRDDMTASAVEAALKRWDVAQEAARPFTEAALMRTRRIDSSTEGK